MTQNDLQNIIEKLEKQATPTAATFGVFDNGRGTDESYIAANKSGLELFALELLKAAKKADEVQIHAKNEIIPIAFQENWIDDQSEITIQYIKLVDQKRADPPQEKKSSLGEKILPYGCFTALTILLIAVIVGLWTMLKWIF